MKYYRIGEFAKLSGISLGLLRHYDKIGLLKPAWRDETDGTRYYTEIQSVQLAEYHMMTKLGFTLYEAKRHRDEDSVDDVLDALHHAKARLEAELLERQSLLRHIEDLAELLSRIQREESWRVEKWEGGLFLEQNRLSDLPAWEGVRKITQVWQQVILDPDDPDANVRQSWGILFPPDTPFGATSKQLQSKTVPGGRCFIYAHSISKDKAKETSDPICLAEDFSIPLQIMRSQGLKPRGDLYQRYLCITHEESGPQIQVLTNIPIQ